MPNENPVGFELSVSGRGDGTLEAVYIQLIDEPVAQTKEIKSDVFLADYSADGRLVGIEILAPVSIAEIEALFEDDESRENFSRFIRKSVPAEMVTA